MIANKTGKTLTILFVVIAIIVALLSLLISNLLVKELADEERNKMEVWALATKSMISEEPGNLELVLKIIQTNDNIPVILHDKGNDMYVSHNIKLPSEDSESFLKKEIAKFKSNHAPI